MPLLIPVAKCGRDSVLKTASSVTREDGPFTCICCDTSLVLRKGNVRKHHFAHSVSEYDRTCSGTGESWSHLHAKTIISTMFDMFTFVFPCKDCGKVLHQKRFSSTIHCSRMEHEVLDRRYRLDVAMLRNNKVCAAIEVLHTHAVGDDKSRALEEAGISVIEVHAGEIIAAYEQTTGRAIVNAEHETVCSACQREGLIRKRREERKKNMRPCVNCKKWKHKENDMVEVEPPEDHSYPTAFACHSCWYMCQRCKLQYSLDSLETCGMYDDYAMKLCRGCALDYNHFISDQCLVLSRPFIRDFDLINRCASYRWPSVHNDPLEALHGTEMQRWELVCRILIRRMRKRKLIREARNQLNALRNYKTAEAEEKRRLQAKQAEVEQRQISADKKALEEHYEYASRLFSWEPELFSRIAKIQGDHPPGPFRDGLESICYQEWDAERRAWLRSGAP